MKKKNVLDLLFIIFIAMFVFGVIGYIVLDLFVG